ncbi:CLUMA_CG009311, isoform A [Clunio marinus]|uniref:PAN2-PAN3 deadenylation complex subunit PAN3 n=1 Tax=Clunio marinus TaxID=568069 RepID=A0A1J1I6H5_9DIPT|nr:CLUMA_CG009311, isoform A [Clunio marinus]
MEFFSNGISNENLAYMGHTNLPYNIQQNNIESPVSFNKKSQVSEFIPPSRLNSTSSPSFYTTYSNTTNIVNGSSSTPTKVYASTSYSVTPIKNRNYLGDSPQNISPKIMPQESPPNIYSAGIHQENVGGTTYFYSQEQPPATYSEEPLLPLSYPITPMPGHIYTPPAHIANNIKPKSYHSSIFFMPEDLRNILLLKNEITNNIEHDSSNLPLEIDNYHSLSLLEATSNLTVPSTTTYKATHSSTGLRYCLRRLHGFRIQSVKQMMQVVEVWKKFSHPNCVTLREVFTTKVFGDNSLILVYDLHAGSQTLLSKYFTPTANGYGTTGSAFSGDARPFSHKSTLQRTANGPILQENELWHLIIQLTCGLKGIHQANLACRSLDPTKIIYDGKRLRFSFVGLNDIITFDPNQQNPFHLVNHYQQDDLTALGKLIVALACRCLQSVHRDQIQHSIDLISRHYSSDLKNLITYLLSPNKMKSIVEGVMPKIGVRFYHHVEYLEKQSDMMENELLKEMDNGRLLRLLFKLGCINERELNLDVTWSETGNRYMLKLFRDYLFHSVTDDGSPWLDYSHVISTLNKLDAGTMEKVQLMSRDEQSVLVLTYAELKQCLVEAFNELSFNNM